MARAMVAGLAVLVVLGAASWATGTALACSGPPYDVNRADVIAEGWIERVKVSPAPSGSGPFHDVTVTMRVTRSLKGDAPSPLVFTDSSSYLPDPMGGPAGFWAGSGGACGVLDADPTGQYALIVFERHDGALVTGLLLGAVFGDRTDDPTLARFRQYLESRLVPGTPPRIVAERPAWHAWFTPARWPFVLAGGVVAASFVVLGGLWVRERWRNA